jgi:hypothetical protein
MTPPDPEFAEGEWTVTEASKRQFGAALWPPGMRVLADVLHRILVLPRALNSTSIKNTY